MSRKSAYKQVLSIGTAVVLVILLAACIAVDMTLPSFHIAVTVIKKATVYALVAVSMNLLNGFTGLFSLGQAGFMLLGAYSYAILTIPVAKRAGVYQYFDGGSGREAKRESQPHRRRSGLGRPARIGNSELHGLRR